MVIYHIGLFRFAFLKVSCGISDWIYPSLLSLVSYKARPHHQISPVGFIPLGELLSSGGPPKISQVSWACQEVTFHIYL